MTATAYRTVFGSLDRYQKGGVQNIADDVKNYAFSNCFDIASRSKPYEKPAAHRRNRPCPTRSGRSSAVRCWCGRPEPAGILKGLERQDRIAPE